MENTLAILGCIVSLTLIMILVLLGASVRIVQEDKRLALYRLGRYLGDKGPGLVLLIPFIDRGIMKELGTMEKTPSQSLVGALGETQTTVFTSGKINLGGEEWDAMSQRLISAGKRVRVVKMVLEVEEEEEPGGEPPSFLSQK